MAEPVALNPRAGQPYSRRFVVEAGKLNWWAELTDFELRCQVRASKSLDSHLLIDLATFLTPTYEGNDLVIRLAMTGADTRPLSRSGYYDLVASDPGVTDGKLLPVARGAFNVDTTMVTTAGG